MTLWARRESNAPSSSLRTPRKWIGSNGSGIGEEIEKQLIAVVYYIF